MNLPTTPLGYTGTCTACGEVLSTAEGVAKHNVHASYGERTYPHGVQLATRANDRDPRVRRAA